jgi:hypothetical protein
VRLLEEVFIEKHRQNARDPSNTLPGFEKNRTNPKVNGSLVDRLAIANFFRTGGFGGSADHGRWID